MMALLPSKRDLVEQQLLERAQPNLGFRLQGGDLRRRFARQRDGG